MRRIITVSAGIICVLVFGFASKIYGIVENITPEQLNNINDPQVMKNVGEKVLSDTGRLGEYEVNDITDVRVYYSDILGNGNQDAVIVVDTVPKRTVAAVYEPNDGAYDFVSDLGFFFDIEDVEFIELPTEGRNLIVIREHADQKLGGLEKNRLLSGYIWDGEDFRPVIKAQTFLEAHWNYLLYTGKSDGQSDWRKVHQKTMTEWSGGDSPALTVTHDQSYHRSNDNESKNIPAEDTFEAVSRRVIKQKYYWSEEWEQFVLDEKNDKSTGQKVAVIEDYDASPFVLLGQNPNKCKILRKDGTTEIVDKSTLSAIDTNVPEPVFMVN